MKRIYIIVASVLLLCFSAIAIKTGLFESLQHISSCENLLIIQVPESYYGDPPSYDTHGPTLTYTVQIVKDLRAEHPTGEKIPISVLRKLKPGSRYLLAGKPASLAGEPWLLFHWENGVTEIPSTFDLATLDDKDVPSQVSAILSARYEEIDRILKELNQEKESIQKIIGEETLDGPSK